MNSRERIIASINHQQPDKVPVDLGSSEVTGICAGALSKLRKYMKMNLPAKVMNPIFMLADVEEVDRELLGLDVVRIAGDMNQMGFKNSAHKSWKLFDGTEVLIGGDFSYTKGEDGSLFFHPGCNSNLPPSAKMPFNGLYFDALPRQGKIDESALDARKDFALDFQLYNDEELRILEAKANHYFYNTNYALCGAFFMGGLGDLGMLPGVDQIHPKGIRNPEDFLMALYLYPNYIKELFEFQTEMAIKNMELYKQAVGEKIQVIVMSATDFGGQSNELISPSLYREFFKPFHTKMNHWVHNNTNWKVFYHTCGSIVNLLDDFVECGVDILNPVQCSAKGMDPVYLKEKFGEKLVFWGGAIDTQSTMQFGTPEEVRKEALYRLSIFAKGGGYIFNPIHNIQDGTPPENIIALFEAVKTFNEQSKM